MDNTTTSFKRGVDAIVNDVAMVESFAEGAVHKRSSSQNEEYSKYDSMKPPPFIGIKLYGLGKSVTIIYRCDNVVTHLFSML